MSKISTVTIEGFLSADPMTGMTDQGKKWLQVSVPHTPRKREGNEWVDAGPTVWTAATFWEAEAETLHPLLAKGTYVTITGVPELAPYINKEGKPAATLRLKFATLGIVPRPVRQEPADQWGAPAGQGTPAAAGPPPTVGSQASQDAWNSAVAANRQQPQGSWETSQAGAYNDETPF